MRRKIPVTLTVKEVNKLIEQPNKRVPTGLRNKVILLFIWDTGARVSDIINLKPSNINISKKEATIINGKGGVDRNLSFSEYTSEMLKKYKESRPKSRYLFSTLNGNKLNRIYLFSMVRRYAKRAGILKKIGIHTLRHSFATDLLRNGADIRSVQEMLGHKNIATTQIYTHVTNPQLKNIHEKFHEK